MFSLLRPNPFRDIFVGSAVSASLKSGQVAAHHLYSAADSPHLAANLDNLITIQVRIHREFHSWMGGSQKPCTLDDFLDFLHDCYDDAPGTDSLSARLHQLKGALQGGKNG
ncbi:MAG: hypothetical protein J7647_02940 [Cyanobacteria bacterium SBLK]|nr:hypothetical protein [Cyanobacteria bacterium SBLK]